MQQDTEVYMRLKVWYDLSLLEKTNETTLDEIPAYFVGEYERPTKPNLRCFLAHKISLMILLPNQSPSMHTSTKMRKGLVWRYVQ